MENISKKCTYLSPSPDPSSQVTASWRTATPPSSTPPPAPSAFNPPTPPSSLTCPTHPAPEGERERRGMEGGREAHQPAGWTTSVAILFLFLEIHRSFEEKNNDNCKKATKNKSFFFALQRFLIFFFFGGGCWVVWGVSSLTRGVVGTERGSCGGRGFKPRTL